MIEGDARRVVATEFGCIRPVRGPSRAAILGSLADQLVLLLARLEPDVVAVETPFAGRHPRSALALAEARGAILAALGRWGGAVVEYEPARVKAAVVGHGRAEKQQVGFVMRHALRLAASPPADAADALAVALCHLRCALS